MMKAARFLFPLVLSVSCMASCSDGGSSLSYTELNNPEKVTILGYSSDAMEPFISRDGKYLFFNNNAAASPKKDIFFAARVSDTVFQYKGPVTAVNSGEVDGVPTLDSGGRIYYVSIVNYTGAGGVTLYRGSWTGSTVTGITPMSGLTIPANLILYFDIDVSPDGSAAYLARGDYTTGPLTAADLVVAADSGSGLSVRADSNAIMAAVNTAGFEYAPAISEDGLELFFTRVSSGATEPRIFRAERSSTNSAFGAVQMVGSIEGFVEGPAFSPDEKSIYYHRLNRATNIFEIYRVTRL
jgi:Tol biopolymer transport system component